MERGIEGADLKIAFDQQVFLLQEYGGISRYFCSLAKEMALISDAKVRIVAPLHFNRHLRQISSSGLVWGRRVAQIPKTFRLIRFLSENLSRLAIKSFHPDIVHETYFATTDFLPKGAKRVLTVYDMIQEKHVASFSGDVTTVAKKSAVLRADHVICISENTRKDLLELFDIPEHKVSVVHLGYDALVPTELLENVLPKTALAPYLLYVGSRGGYKNFEGLIRAIVCSKYLKENFSVICFGGGEFRAEEINLFNELGLNLEQIRQIGGGDNVLAKLYEGADAFIYPSFYEGFGIPPLEAMSLGCPVICSDTSSLPEVVGDAGEYFDPANSESICCAIEKVLQSQGRRAELVQKGYRRCMNFSWEKCASETMSIYRSLK